MVCLNLMTYLSKISTYITSFGKLPCAPVWAEYTSSVLHNSCAHASVWSHLFLVHSLCSLLDYKFLRVETDFWVCQPQGWYPDGTQRCLLSEQMSQAGLSAFYCKAMLWLRYAHLPRPRHPSLQVCSPGPRSLTSSYINFPNLSWVWPPFGASTPAPHLEPISLST